MVGATKRKYEHLYNKANGKAVGHQYNETNRMHIAFNLLRIKGLYITCFEHYLLFLRIP
jgi:hypothetical protein